MGSSTGFFRLLFWVRECQSSTGFFRLLFLGSGVSVLHRIFPSPFSGFGSVSSPQDFSVSFFWVRECQSSTGFFRLLFWVRECQSSTGFFRLLFLGSGVSVLHRIFPSP